MTPALKLKDIYSLGKKAMTKLDRVLKSKDITLPANICIVKAMVFPVVMYKYESWTIKKGSAPKNWCFQIVVPEKTLESPLTVRTNQSILKEINPEYSMEGLMLKLKLQYYVHLRRRAYSLEKPLMLGKIEGRRRKGSRGGDGWMASLTQCMWISANSGR